MKRLLIGTFLLYTLSPAHGAWNWRGCASTIGHLFSFRTSTEPSPSEFTSDQIQVIKTWAASHHFSAGYAAGTISDEQVALALSELPLGIREKVFGEGDEGSQLRWSDLVEGRLNKIGIHSWEIPPIYAATKRFGNGEIADRYKNLELFIQSIEKLELVLRQKIAADYRRVREVASLKRSFLEYANPEYRLRFEGPEVVFPDGVRYRYEKLWLGKIKIWVKYKNILRTQDYESQKKVAEYLVSGFRAESGFEDLLAPDGRVLLYDAHHRTKAYALKYQSKGQRLEETLVPFVLSPQTDGYFYTVSHWSILSSRNYRALPLELRKWAKDPSWSFLLEDEREAFLALCRKSTLRAFQELYYRETRLPRLTLGDR